MPVTISTERRTSRHERRPTQLFQRQGSIFDLAKAASVRRGSHDTDSALSSPTFASFAAKSRNNSINTAYILSGAPSSPSSQLQPNSPSTPRKQSQSHLALQASKKRPQYLTPTLPATVDFAAARTHYESSAESFSPTLSDFSADGSDAWFSDIATPRSVFSDVFDSPAKHPAFAEEEAEDYLTPHAGAPVSEEEYSILLHRAAALAALEGRAPSVPAKEWTPLLRTSRSEYEDHVEAEHGTLQCLSPRPQRPAKRVQTGISAWETALAALPPPPKMKLEKLEKVGLGICMPRKRIGGAGAKDVEEWLQLGAEKGDVEEWVQLGGSVDSAVDVRSSRKVSDEDAFWAEDMTLEQINAHYLVSFKQLPKIAV